LQRMHLETVCQIGVQFSTHVFTFSSMLCCFQYGRWLVIQDLLDSWMQWLVILGVTAMHTLLTFLLPVPDCPMGYLGPGGLHNHSFSPNCTGGAAGYLDRIVFGEQHIYQHPTCQYIYGTTVPYDPEGAEVHRPNLVDTYFINPFIFCILNSLVT